MKKLELAKAPNLKDPRVRERISIVLEWAMPKLGLKEPFQCHTDTLRNVFSNHKRGLGEFLFANIMRSESLSYKASSGNGVGFCKTYRISHSGFNKVCGMLYGVEDLSPTSTESKKRTFSVQYAKERYKDELAGNKLFAYDDKSYRLSHELQGFKRELKDEIFEGWHDYDISAAMPSIFWGLHQQYQEIAWRTDPVKASMKELPFVHDYISNKAAIRQALADRIGIDLAAAKAIINGLFQRMRLVAHWTCAAFELVGFDKRKMSALKADPFIKGLQKDIRKFWALTGKRVNTQRTRSGLPHIDRKLLYFYYERRVLDVVRKSLVDQDAIYFLEHDGFRTKEPVDLVAIKNRVKEETGFDLTWEEK